MFWNIFKVLNYVDVICFLYEGKLMEFLNKFSCFFLRYIFVSSLLYCLFMRNYFLLIFVFICLFDLFLVSCGMLMI